MKISPLLLSLATGSIASAVGVVHNEVAFQYSVDLNLQHDTILTQEEEDFVATCFTDSYDQGHQDPEDNLGTTIASFALPHAVVQNNDDGAHRSLQTPPRPEWKGTSFYMVVYNWFRMFRDPGLCNLCWDDPYRRLSHASDELAAWEELFCSKLREGPYEVFQSAIKCHITHQTISEEDRANNGRKLAAKSTLTTPKLRGGPPLSQD